MAGTGAKVTPQLNAYHKLFIDDFVIVMIEMEKKKIRELVQKKISEEKKIKEEFREKEIQ